MTDQKEVEFYAAKANAWFSTKLEYDKSLLFLSAGAIALLVTLLTTVGVNSILSLFIFTGAVSSFVICLFSLLAIFNGNAKHLEMLISGKHENDGVLALLDNISIISFVIGVILTAIIGLSTATNIFILKENAMSEKTDQSQTPIPLNDSFNRAQNIAPGNTRSFNGAQNVAPPQSEQETSSSAGETDQSSTNSSSEQE